MKKVLQIGRILIVASIVVILLVGCPQEEESGLSTQEVHNAAMGTALTGMTSVQTFFLFTQSNEATVEAQYPGLDITEGASTVTFTYTNAGIDLDDDSTADVIIDGTFVVSDNGVNYTFTSFTIKNASNTSETYLINGSIAITGTDPTVIASTFSVSGTLVSSTLEIVTTMSMPQSGEPTFSAATINGEDYLTEFNSAVANM